MSERGVFAVDRGAIAQIEAQHCIDKSFRRGHAQAARRIETCGPRIAVVTHGGVVRALLTHWLDMSHKSAWRFAVGNAAVSTLTIHEGLGTLRSFGVDPGRCSWEEPAR